MSSANFKHLEHLPIDRGWSDKALAFLNQSEDLHAQDPSMCVSLGRLAIERLAFGYGNSLGLPSASSAEQSLRTLIRHFEGSRRTKHAIVWNELSLLEEHWRTLASAGNEPHPDAAVVELERLWRATWTLCLLDQNPQAPVQIRPFVIAQVPRVPGVDSEQLRRLVRTSEARVVELNTRVADLERMLKGSSDERRAAIAQIEQLKQERAEVDAEIAAYAEKLAKVAKTTWRIEYYEREYPGLVQAHEFFQTVMTGDEEGALPPLNGLASATLFAEDRYASRYEAIFHGSSCTLRVIRAHEAVLDDDRCSAWKFEAYNLARLKESPPIPSIARLRLGAQRERAGFALFERPTCPLLSEYGQDGRSMRLDSALRCARALFEVLVVRSKAKMTVSWPDADAIGIQSDAPILLEPSAPHFGDLGPLDYVHLSAERGQAMQREELEAGWAYAIAHTFLRLIKASPKFAVGEHVGARLDETQLRTHLEECRMRCQIPLGLEPTRRLAAALIAAVEINRHKRAQLETLVQALRAPLTQ